MTTTKVAKRPVQAQAKRCDVHLQRARCVLDAHPRKHLTSSHQFGTVEATLDQMKSECGYENGYCSGDWGNVFGYAHQSGQTSVPGDSVELRGFLVDDVEEVVASVNGDNDGPSWVAILRLRDGRFARLAAGCDNTGWGCQEGGDSVVASTLAGLIRFGMTVEERKRCGLSLPEDREKGEG